MIENRGGNCNIFKKHAISVSHFLYKFFILKRICRGYTKQKETAFFETASFINLKNEIYCFTNLLNAVSPFAHIALII